MLTSLRIQLDDHSFLDRQINIFTFRHPGDSPCDVFAVEFEPMRGAPAADEIHGAHHLDILLHLFFDADLLAGDDLERRDVDFFAVDEDVSMTDELPGLSMGTGKTETDKH